MLQTLIFHQRIVPDNALDQLQANLPGVIAEVLRVPGGNMALLEAEQISLHFIEASPRDVAKNIHVLIYAGLNEPRQRDKANRASKIREEIVSLIGGDYTIDVRIYLQQIGAAQELTASRDESATEE